MITEAKPVKPTEEELYRERVFRVQGPLRPISLFIAFAAPPLLYWIGSQDLIPNGHTARYWFLALQMSCFGLFLGGLYLFFFSFRTLRVNQAGLHFTSAIGGRSMPWDELLSYDVSPTGRFVDIIDFRGRQIRVDLAVFGFDAMHVLKRHVAGSRDRAFEHIERRGLNCKVRSRLMLGVFFGLLSVGMFYGVVRTAALYPPTDQLMLYSYWGAQGIAVLALLVVLYRFTVTLRADRFSLSRWSLFGKRSISFSQVAIIELWLDEGEHKGWTTEMMAVTGKSGRRMVFSQALRNFILLRAYVVAKCPHALLQDACPSDWPH